MFPYRIVGVCLSDECRGVVRSLLLGGDVAAGVIRPFGLEPDMHGCEGIPDILCLLYRAHFRVICIFLLFCYYIHLATKNILERSSELGNLDIIQSSIDYIEKNRDELIKIASGLISIPSVSGREDSRDSASVLK